MKLLQNGTRHLQSILLVLIISFIVLANCSSSSDSSGGDDSDDRGVYVTSNLPDKYSSDVPDSISPKYSGSLNALSARNVVKADAADFNSGLEAIQEAVEGIQEVRFDEEIDLEYILLLMQHYQTRWPTSKKIIQIQYLREHYLFHLPSLCKTEFWTHSCNI